MAVRAQKRGKPHLKIAVDWGLHPDAKRIVTREMETILLGRVSTNLRLEAVLSNTVVKADTVEASGERCGLPSLLYTV